jgi:hypothetical protein
VLTVEVRVTGPGECLPMNLLKEALESTGATVIVEDAYPTERPLVAPYKGWTFKLVANHCPWGG